MRTEHKMKKLYIGIIILIVGTLVFAADVKWSAITVQNSAIDDDRVLIVDDANGTPASVAVPRNYFLLDAIGTAEMADADHGDGAWSGGALSIEAMTLNDASTGTFYLGLFADDQGANRPIYADAPLSYVQATGTLTAGEYSGGGSSLTSLTGSAITANTIDEPTLETTNAAGPGTDNYVLSYNDAGTNFTWVDISGLGGGDMLKSTYDVADDDFVDANDTAYAASWNGNINAPSSNTVYDKIESLELSNLTDVATTGTDPDVDASGELGIDTDGANEPNDVVLRTADLGGDTQYALAQVVKSFQGTIITPNDLDDATRDALIYWENSTGMTFIITKIRAWSDTDDTTVNVETYDSDWDNNATVNACEIATDEVANFSFEDTSITAPTIANGSLIVLDFDDTDNPGWVKFNIMGYLISDVD